MEDLPTAESPNRIILASIWPPPRPRRERSTLLPAAFARPPPAFDALILTPSPREFAP